jgi:alkanesulfonate monooxygenase SsuD/methylene tetrahydromethanopterin reductase-like flavin-dependent oxidoreductase (luciferase family)
MRKFVACEADGWIPAKLTPKKFGIYMDEILANAEKCGRKRKELKIIYSTRILTGPHLEELQKILPISEIMLLKKEGILGTSEDCVQTIQKYVDLGVDLILLRLNYIARRSFKTNVYEQIEFIKNEVISKIN